MLSTTRLLAFTAFLAITLTPPACSKEAKKERVLTRAEEYFAAGEYEKAKIEYMNALRADSGNPGIFERMGEIWLAQGAPLRAYPFIAKAVELEPKNLALRAKKAETLLTFGQVPQARAEAITILDADPGHAAGIRVLADVSRTAEEIAEVEQRLEKFPDREASAYHFAQGTLALRKRELPAAEAAIQKGLAADPKSVGGHAMLAALYTFQGKKEEAAKAAQAAGELAPLRSQDRVSYVVVKIQEGKLDEARKLLAEILKDAPDFLPAIRVQAQLAFAEKKYDEAQTLLDKLFGIDPENIEGRMLRAEVLLAQGDTKKAIETLESVAAKFPLPIVQLQLAKAYVRDRNLSKATALLNQAVQNNHNFIEAILLLAQLDLQSGNASAAITALEDLRKRAPKLPQAQTLLTEAYRAVGRLADAAALVRERIEVNPEDPQLHWALGIIHRQQKQTAEARAAFEKALALAPGNLATLNQLIELDLEEKNYAAASEKIQKLLAAEPNAAAPHFLQAKVHLAEQQTDQAEAALQKALELDPNFGGAYDLLISIYVGTQKLPEALAQLDAVLEKNPSSVRALLLTAMIHEQTKDYPKARDAYEKLLGVAPDSPIAQNNLAYLYTEHLQDLDKAFDLGRKARAARPQDASVADTLGWIHFRRKEYAQALPLLQESAASLAENAEVQFHLGMTHYMMGQREAALAAFQKATSAPGEFRGKEEVSARLRLLEQPEAVREEELRAMVEKDSADALAWLELGSKLQVKGEHEQAAAAYEGALAANPRLPRALLAMVDLHIGPLNKPARAMEFARRAREVAPQDPATSDALGRAAFHTGNVEMAYTMLQESAQARRGAVPPIELGQAAYALSKLDEAEAAIKKIAALPPQDPAGEKGRAFLKLLTLPRDEAALRQNIGEVNATLKSEPGNLPALVALGAFQRLEGEPAAAVATYEKALKQQPDFALAQKELAALYLMDPKSRDKAHELASRASRVLSEDRELALTLAETSFHRKEYATTRLLLEQSAAKSPLDSERLYLLGVACKAEGDKPAAIHALEQALNGKLPEAAAADARKLLEELKKS